MMHDMDALANVIASVAVIDTLLDSRCGPSILKQRHTYKCNSPPILHKLLELDYVGRPE